MKVFSARDLAPLPRPSGPDSRGLPSSSSALARRSRRAPSHWLPLSRSPRSFSSRFFSRAGLRARAFLFPFVRPLPCVVFFLLPPSLSGRRGSPPPSSRRVLLVDCRAAFTIVCRRGPTGCVLPAVPAVCARERLAPVKCASPVCQSCSTLCACSLLLPCASCRVADPRRVCVRDSRRPLDYCAPPR